jgi:predicted nucleic acid-binding protein
VSHFYLDASAVVKRYSPETGTAWVKALTAPAAGHTIVLGEITLAEVAAAVAAKHRAPGGITLEERDNAITLFLSHCMTDYELIAINRSIIERAVNLTLRHKLRGYDAVQLATALAANEAFTAAALAPLIFVAADVDLVAAAGAEGLATENPNLHVTS